MTKTIRLGVLSACLLACLLTTACSQVPVRYVSVTDTKLSVVPIKPEDLVLQPVQETPGTTNGSLADGFEANRKAADACNLQITDIIVQQQAFQTANPPH
jgi:hypothetical protein